MKLAAQLSGLMEQQGSALDIGSKYWLSLTIPFEYGDKNQLKTRTKSLLQNAFAEHRTLSTEISDSVQAVVLSHVVKAVLALPEGYQGIAFFLQFATEQQQELVRYQKSIGLEIEPSATAYISSCFDSTELLRTAINEPRILIVTIHKDGANIYQIIGKQLKERTSLKNTYNQPTANEYIGRYSPLKSGKIIHGSGSENVARRQISANKYFLETDLKPALTMALQEGHWKQLLLFYAPDYSEYLDSWTEQLPIGDLPFGFQEIKTLPPTSEELVAKALSLTNKSREEWLKQQIQADKENYAHFRTGWEAVCDATREGRVKRLYLKPEALSPVGYIAEGELPFLFEAEGNGIKTNNLRPWLIYTALKNSGEVFISDVWEEELDQPIAAALRY